MAICQMYALIYISFVYSNVFVILVELTIYVYKCPQKILSTFQLVMYDVMSSQGQSRKKNVELEWNRPHIVLN